MVKNVLLSVLVSALAVGAYACDEGGEKVDVTKDCDVNSHVVVCSSDNQALTKCVDGITVDIICEMQLANSKCELVDGTAQCVLKSAEDCDDSYTATCDGNGVKQCVSGKVSTIPCGENQICEGNACKDAPQQCGDDFVAQCVGTDKVTVCDSGTVKEVTCDAGFACSENACKCSPESYQPTCKDASAQLICNDGVIEEKSCESNQKCELVDGTAQCVLESAEDCDDSYQPTCDGNGVKQCVSGKVSTIPCGENQICEGNACKDAPQECGDDFVAQCVGTDKVTVCDSGTVKEVPCDAGFACSENACKCSPESYQPTCKDASAQLICNDGVIEEKSCESNQVCNATTNACEDAVGSCTLPFVSSCLNNAKTSCESGIIVETDCGAQACSLGECVDLPVVGSDCQETDVQLCHENVILYCDEGTVSDEYVCDEQAPCDVIGGIADCYSPCTEADLNNETKSCYNFYGALYPMTETCVATDRGNYANDVEFAEPCPSGCEDGVCVVWSEDIGKPCDDTYKASCGGDANDVALNCGYFSEVVEGEKCAGTTVCVVDASNALCLEPCTTLGEEKFACDPVYVGDSNQYACELIDGKNVYSLLDYEECANGCDETTGKCTVLDPSEGTSCGAEYTPNCSASGVALYCKEGVVAADACEGATCGTITEGSDVSIGCFAACTTPGTTRMACVDIYSVEYECYALDGGSNGEAVAAYQQCANGCDDTTGLCIKLHSQEGTACDLTTPETCESNVLGFCGNSGTVVTLNCNKIPGTQCAIDSTGYGECYESCTVADDIQYACDGSNSMATRCRKLEDGSLGSAVDYDLSEECANECDAATGKCIKLHSQEGTACDHTTPETCESNVLGYCGYSGTVVTLNCNKIPGTQCAIDSTGYGECYESCTVADDIQYACDGSYSITTRCRELADGSLGSAVDDVEECANECDPTTGKCL